MKINRNTRIAQLIKNNDQTIDALIRVSVRFSKLKNPVLRKIMAAQVTIGMAAKVGGVTEVAILEALEKIGFEIENSTAKSAIEADQSGKSEFFEEFEKIDPIQTFDARPFMQKGEEPLTAILQIANTIPVNAGLKIIQSFSPEPLLNLLAKKGFEGYIFLNVDEDSDDENPEVFHACFIRRTDLRFQNPQKKTGFNHIYDTVAVETNRQVLRKETGMKTATGKNRAIVRISVCGLKPPAPMTRILNILQQMSSKQVLYVYHERIPQYLIPHLVQDGYSYGWITKSHTDIRFIVYKKS